MTNRQKRITAAICAYFFIAAFTYGYAYRLELNFQNAKWPEYVLTNRASAEFSGFICAAAWPLYWPFHISKVLWLKANP